MSNQPAEGDCRVKGRGLEVFYRGEWRYCNARSDYERGRADMLEQVIECIEASLMDAYLYVDFSGAYTIDVEAFLEDLKKAMRKAWEDQ